MQPASLVYLAKPVLTPCSPCQHPCLRLHRWLLMTWGYSAFALLPLLSSAALLLGVGLTILGKWLFVGRYREGEFPIWGWQYIRHWLANQFVVVSAKGLKKHMSQQLPAC